MIKIDGLSFIEIDDLISDKSNKKINIQLLHIIISNFTI